MNRQVKQSLIQGTQRPERNGAPYAYREEARRRFLKSGFPSDRVEAYKYSSLRSLERHAWPVDAERAPAPTPVLAQAPWRQYCWENGWAPEAPLPRGLMALQAEQSPMLSGALDPLIGQLANKDDPIVNLNTANFHYGYGIDWPSEQPSGQPLGLIFSRTPALQPAGSHGRGIVHLGSGSRLILFESQLGAQDEGEEELMTFVNEIVLDEQSELIHVRLTSGGERSRLLTHTEVALSAGSHYRCLSIDARTRQVRNTLRVHLQGPRAGCQLSGLQILTAREHVDNDVTVFHDAPQGESRQEFRAILDGRSQGVYSGRVIVAAGASETDASQHSANLLLSQKAEADTRPQLEIYTDDVKCSHGTATGEIDADSLFYLRSRGIDSDEARRMIAYGFAAKVLDALPTGDVRTYTSKLVAQWLQSPARELR